MSGSRCFVIRLSSSGHCCQTFVVRQLLSSFCPQPGCHCQVVVKTSSSPRPSLSGHHQAIVIVRRSSTGSFCQAIVVSQAVIARLLMRSRHRQAIVIVRLSSSGSCCCHVVSSCLLCSSSLKNTMLAVTGKVSWKGLAILD